jgi:hypothetical protein
MRRSRRRERDPFRGAKGVSTIVVPQVELSSKNYKSQINQSGRIGSTVGTFSVSSLTRPLNIRSRMSFNSLTALNFANGIGGVNSGLGQVAKRKVEVLAIEDHRVG